MTSYLVVQWPILLLAILLGTAFAVGLGILLGLLNESQASLGMWGGPILMMLLVASMFQYFDTANLPPVAQALVNFHPTTALIRLIGIGLTNQIPPDIFWQNTLILLAFSSAVYILVGWNLRRSKR